MLVLTRKKEESIMIGDDIELVILDISSSQIRLGIKAPKELEVYRKEIYLAIQEENNKAAENSMDIQKVKDELKGLFNK